MANPIPGCSIHPFECPILGYSMHPFAVRCVEKVVEVTNKGTGNEIYYTKTVPLLI